MFLDPPSFVEYSRGRADHRLEVVARDGRARGAHHRGQLYLMAGMRGISIPPLYGLTEEEVASSSEPSVGGSRQ